MVVSALIPSSVLPILPPEHDSSEPRRITLVNKRGDSLVCLLSRGIEEVTYETPLQDVLVLRMFGPKKVRITYEPEVTFHRRDIDAERHYSVVGVKNGLTDKVDKKKIPFLGPKIFLSDIVSNGVGLNKKIDDLLDLANERIIAYCEAIADRGIFRLRKDKRLRDIYSRAEEIEARIYKDIYGLFHEEQDNRPIRRNELRAADRSLDDYFSDPRPISKKIKNYTKVFFIWIPLVSLLPSSLIDYFEKQTKSRYEKRFSQIEDEKEQAAIALSEFAIANPKLIAGIRRGFSEFKALSNLTIYSLQLSIAGYAVYNWSPWISIPIGIPTAITGATMVRNAVRSGFQDYSGIISTAIESNLRKELG